MLWMRFIISKREQRGSLPCFSFFIRCYYGRREKLCKNLKNSLVCFLLLLGLKFIWFLSMFMLRVSIVTSHSTSAMKTLNHRLLLLLVLLDDDIWILMKINHDFLVYQIYTAKIATQMAISAASLRTFLHINSEELGGTTSISVKNVLPIFLFHWLLDDSFRIIITTDISTPFALFSATLHGDSCMRFNNARDNSFLRPITKKNTCRLILEANISRLLWGCWEISLEIHGSASGKWTEFSSSLCRVFPSHSVDAESGDTNVLTTRGKKENFNLQIYSRKKVK